MKVVDIANEIYLENASPSDTSISSIAFWIRSSVGKLNNLVYESFVVDSTSLEVVDGSGKEISTLAAAIIKMMYKVYRIDLDIRSNMTSLTNDTVLEAVDENFKIKRINRSEVLKTLATLKKDSLKELTDIVHYYRSYNGSPDSISGDDTQWGYYQGTSTQYVRSVVGPV